MYMYTRSIPHGVCSRGRTEGPLFNSYYSEMYGKALLPSLDCSTLPLIRTLYCWVLSKELSSTIFKVFGMTWPGIEPRSSRPLVNTLSTTKIIFKVLFETINDIYLLLYRQNAFKALCLIFKLDRNSAGFLRDPIVILELYKLPDAKRRYSIISSHLSNFYRYGSYFDRQVIMGNFMYKDVLKKYRDWSCIHQDRNEQSALQPFTHKLGKIWIHACSKSITEKWTQSSNICTQLPDLVLAVFQPSWTIQCQIHVCRITVAVLFNP